MRRTGSTAQWSVPNRKFPSPRTSHPALSLPRTGSPSPWTTQNRKSQSSLCPDPEVFSSLQDRKSRPLAFHPRQEVPPHRFPSAGSPALSLHLAQKVPPQHPLPRTGSPAPHRPILAFQGRKSRLPQPWRPSCAPPPQQWPPSFAPNLHGRPPTPVAPPPAPPGRSRGPPPTLIHPKFHPSLCPPTLTPSPNRSPPHPTPPLTPNFDPPTLKHRPLCPPIP